MRGSLQIVVSGSSSHLRILFSRLTLWWWRRWTAWIRIGIPITALRRRRALMIAVVSILWWRRSAVALRWWWTARHCQLPRRVKNATHATARISPVVSLRRRAAVLLRRRILLLRRIAGIMAAALLTRIVGHDRRTGQVLRPQVGEGDNLPRCKAPWIVECFGGVRRW